MIAHSARAHAHTQTHTERRGKARHGTTRHNGQYVISFICWDFQHLNLHKYPHPHPHAEKKGSADEKKSHKTNCALSFSVSFVLLLIYNIVFCCMRSMIVSFGLASFGFGLVWPGWTAYSQRCGPRVCSVRKSTIHLSFIGSINIICCRDVRTRLSTKFIILIFHLLLRASWPCASENFFAKFCQFHDGFCSSLALARCFRCCVDAVAIVFEYFLFDFIFPGAIR